MTLLPVLLATVARRMDWPHRRRLANSRIWTAWARLVMRRRWTAALAAFAVLGALGAAALGIKVGEPAASSLGTTAPAAQTLRTLEHGGIPAGVLDPIEVLVPASANPDGLALRLAGRARGADRGRARRSGLAARRHRPGQCPARRRALHPGGRGHPGQGPAGRRHHPGIPGRSPTGCR